MKKNIRNIVILISLIFIYLLYGYMTFLTPLAGDDWGYYLNGLNLDPISGAISFYFSWSGRFISEFWTFLACSNRIVWDVINPILYVIIFICFIKLAKFKNKVIISSLLFLSFALSMDSNLRMETIWIAGTTYPIALVFSLVYFVEIKKIYDTKQVSIKSVITTNLCLLIISLMIENIAATMILVCIIECIYFNFIDKKLFKYFLINLIFAIAGFLIMRLSPGSTYRLINNHKDWISLSFIEQIKVSYPTFIEMTFAQNRYTMLLFSLVSIVFGFSHISKKSYLIFLYIAFNLLSIFFAFIGLFTNKFELISLIFWPLYIIITFIVMFIYLNGFKKDIIILFLIVAGCSNAVMMFSPIFGSRSSIYFVYYLALISCIIIEDIKLNRYIYITLGLLLAVLVLRKTQEYIYKYKLVKEFTVLRLEQIKYYKEHPEESQAWIIRYPIFTIHGADIEPDDLYHLETFKDYYNLPQEASNIIFYFPEN